MVRASMKRLLNLFLGPIPRISFSIHFAIPFIMSSSCRTYLKFLSSERWINHFDLSRIGQEMAEKLMGMLPPEMMEMLQSRMPRQRAERSPDDDVSDDSTSGSNSEDGDNSSVDGSDSTSENTGL